MTTHAEAGDGPSGAVGDGPVVFVDVFDELFGHEGFIAVVGICRAVPVPAVAAAIGADGDAVDFGDILGQFGAGPVDIDAVISSVSVQQIDYRIFLFGDLS